MTKIKFTSIIILVLLMTTWGIIFGGNSISLYWDVPTILMVILLPYIVASLIYPFRDQIKFNKELFKEVGTGEKKELERAISFYELLKKLVIAATVLTTLIGFIGILAWLEDIDSVGKNLAVMSITIFYSAIYLLAVIEPLKGAAKNNLIG